MPFSDAYRRTAQDTFERLSRAGLVVVISPLGGLLGFAPLPPLFFGVLVLMTTTYLALVQVIKRRFYAANDWRAA